MTLSAQPERPLCAKSGHQTYVRDDNGIKLNYDVSASLR